MSFTSVKSEGQNYQLPAGSVGSETQEKGLHMGFIGLGLTSWATLSLILMILRSWAATNWDWVAILCGLLCISASLSIVIWKTVALDYRERGEEDGE